MTAAQSVTATSRAVAARAGSNCSSACVSKDHRSFGECMRSKNLHLSPHVNGEYAVRQKAWDKELNNYESAVRQGLEPAGTKQHHIDAAVRKADNG